MHGIMSKIGQTEEAAAHRHLDYYSKSINGHSYLTEPGTDILCNLQPDAERGSTGCTAQRSGFVFPSSIGMASMRVRGGATQR